MGLWIHKSPINFQQASLSMEISSPRWLSDLVVDDDINPMLPFQRWYGLIPPLEDCNLELPQSFPEETYSMNPAKKIKLNSLSNSSDSQIISFQNDAVSSRNCAAADLVSISPDSNRKSTNGGGVSRSSLHAQDHVLAERKRREKLSQRFIALSAMIPDLKKMDKATVLSDAIKHIKYLQERVKTLETDTTKKTMVIVKKSQASADDDACSSDESSCSQKIDHHLPEIEARVSEKQVLIRVHSERRHGSITKVLDQVEKMKLTILNTGVVPFGSSRVDITIVAQKEDEFCMTIEEIVNKLRHHLLNSVM